MIVQVKLLQYASKIFTYSVPQNLKTQVQQGSLVKVPLKNKVVPAVVHSIDLSGSVFAFVVKSIIDVYKFPTDDSYQKLLQKIGHLYQVDPIIFLQRLQYVLDEKEITDVPFGFIDHAQAQIDLTVEQKNVVHEIMPNIKNHHHEVFVLHGVTASGKTIVYKTLIEQVLLQQQSVIVMLPEVSLAIQFEKIFRQYFPAVSVFGFHCATTKKHKNELWDALLAKRPIILLGVHLPVLLPIANLGLIIVDEEHDHGYQEKKYPKLHSRDMAILKAKLLNVPILLGSATPSIATLHNVYARDWKLLTIKQRFSGMFPRVHVVDMKQHKQRKHFWFSQILLDAIADRLERQEQIIIFLNRRGFSFFVQCVCSFVFMCRHCSVSLTLHDGFKLLCHYCGYYEMMPSVCPDCKEQSHNFLKKGIGTQQVVSLLEKIFPQARIARADMDSTKQKKTWSETVVMMQNKELDVLVGTQTITKGYHFSGVTLVGVLWADLNLHFPMYNAAEVCLQQLIQVAGRAGRQSSDSLVILQAFDQHPIFRFLSEIDYMQFYNFEIEKRQQAQYPPSMHIAQIEIRGDDATLVREQANRFINVCKDYVDLHKIDIQILGPVPAMVHKIKAVYSEQLYFKSLSRAHMIDLFETVQPELDRSVFAFITINPV
ncbi:primosomal protein N' [Candidatus Babeliales bacterium]|nr:primosomal protein N' [Candidatus Babeliales bacterium]